MIVLNKVAKSYGNFNFFVDCTLPEGRLISLLGPSGCGKSTFLRIMAGFIHDHEGEILLGNQPMAKLSPEDRNMGMVFQDYALFPHMTVEENIGYGLKIRKSPRSEIKTRVGGLLKLVSLEGYEKRLPHNLSGGEKQRVALARALSPQPQVLLLDEPFSALDAALRKELRILIRKIQKETGLTVIFVTHDQEEAMAISDYLVILSGGKIAGQGVPEEIYHKPDNPFTARFLGIHREHLITETMREKFKMSFLTLKQEQAQVLLKKGNTLFFRPEHCQVIVDKNRCSDGEEAHIVYREYGGDRFLLDLEVGEINLPAYCPALSKIRDTETCRVIINWSAVISLPPGRETEKPARKNQTP